MLGNMLKGFAWCSTLALATVGALTFVPDESWERFPSALAPTRAQLAEFGIAPIKYRASVSDGEIARVDENASTEFSNSARVASTDESVSKSRSRVRVGGVRGSFSGAASSNFDVGSLDSPTPRASRQEEIEPRVSESTNSVAKGAVDSPEIRAPLFEGEAEASAPVFDPTREIPSPAPVEDPSSFSPDLFAENATNSGDLNASVQVAPVPTTDLSTPVVASNDLSALEPTPFPAQVDELQNPPVAEPLETIPAAPLAEQSLEQSPKQQAAPIDVSEPNSLAQNENVNSELDVTTLSSDASVLQAPPSRPSLRASEPLATTSQIDSQGFMPNASSTSDVLSVSADLERALSAVRALDSNERARDVLMTLNRIQRTQRDVLAEADQARLNEALDQLAYEAFYNPTRFLLEAPRKTAPGETLSSIAREYDVAPRLLASINGLNYGDDDPLPPGTALKTVRGPATAEVSIGKKELLLRFNDIYAGRFKLGVPRQATTLRGVHLVESKLTNPACDAVDASGATISIPGGSPDNPLGSCWIGLSGGYGLQGTNRPELVGTIVPENGGFVFSNLEISQLDVLLPVGATISFVD